MFGDCLPIMKTQLHSKEIFTIMYTNWVSLSLTELILKRKLLLSIKHGVEIVRLERKWFDRDVFSIIFVRQGY